MRKILDGLAILLLVAVVLFFLKWPAVKAPPPAVKPAPDQPTQRAGLVQQAVCFRQAVFLWSMIIS